MSNLVSYHVVVCFSPFPVMPKVCSHKANGLFNEHLDQQ
ncbi:hypothetical protein OOU_Y34scaffold00336g1 [Pyricularia oryzae Y34]|uniref:Uncharacterized protein n=2 Tax=Pyricularia oryzae TaxID=318829 RepID=A0AA97P2P2_PYRO3|nr:hypothetical protein OOU_Y34scaffold00336g1 [Pyricularia oryzae Y34]